MWSFHYSNKKIPLYFLLIELYCQLDNCVFSQYCNLFANIFIFFTVFFYQQKNACIITHNIRFIIHKLFYFTGWSNNKALVNMIFFNFYSSTSVFVFLLQDVYGTCIKENNDLVWYKFVCLCYCSAMTVINQCVFADVLDTHPRHS